MMSVWVVVWSAALPIVALVNVAAWAMVASTLWRRREQSATPVAGFRRWQLLLSAGYVFGCAYRSVLPVFDVPRVALIDSVLSTAAVGRSVATIAELCFIAQWALLLRETSRATGSLMGSVAARLLVPLIVVAEVCSWYSVLTTSNLGHVFEESLWSVATALVTANLLLLLQRPGVRWRGVGAWLVAGGVAYLLYLVLVDVPMYWSRWMADQAIGKSYLSLAQGWLNASGPHVVTYTWDVWKSEMAWMAAYFSVGVWASIWLVRAPLRLGRVATRALPRRSPAPMAGLGAWLAPRSVLVSGRPSAYRRR
jgi:hypothetical protein